MITLDELKLFRFSKQGGDNKTRRNCMEVINNKLFDKLSRFEKSFCISALNVIIENTESDYHSFIDEYHDLSKRIYVLMECDRLKVTCHDSDLIIEKDFNTQVEYDIVSKRVLSLVQSVDIKDIEISCKNTFISKYSEDIKELLDLINEFKNIIQDAKSLLIKLN